jgi:hypothetical protein
MPDPCAPDGGIPAAEDVTVDKEALAAGAATGDGVAAGVSIRYWKKLYWTGGEPDPLAGNAAGVSEF